ncbi:hypothetical protein METBISCDRAFT_22308 [Metschnikowia bicuspidata]|uniref:Uncharacterized protein n=1 Tax=Metschnikowia bicuspidata TaxID=27322 RepID=A0A4P9ZHU8_9ASCO|nr:hypothetical protein METBISCDRAFT_22308 [Metschnikowia bicuspidata]
MPSMSTLGNLKKVVTKKIHQTVRRLEKNLENLGRVANPVPERVPIPVNIPTPQGARAFHFTTCSWERIIFCFTQLFKCPPHTQSHPSTTDGPRHSVQFSRPQIGYLPKPAVFPKSALFGSSISQTIALSIYGTRLATASLNANFHATRFYSTYSNLSGCNQWSWANINRSILFKHFSSKANFRLLKLLSFYRLPALTQTFKKRSMVYGEWDTRMPMWTIFSNFSKNTAKLVLQSAVKTAAATTLRLNALLTQGFHDMVLVLANEASTVAEGSYVDFKLQPLVLIPEKSMMSAEVLKELLSNLRHFERHLQQLQRDILKLGELGELLLRFVAEKCIIRVYFPNCDFERLQVLLREKNVCSGTIHEDLKQEASNLTRLSNVSSVTETDILSSYQSLVESSSGSEDSDVFSIQTSSSAMEKNLPGNMLPIQLGGIVPSQSGHVVFAEDSYCWA